MTDAPVQAKPLTLEQFMEADSRLEIIDWEIVPMTAAGVSHHIVAGNLYNAIYAHVNSRDLGAVFFDGFTYLMFSESGGLKDSFVPDVSFIRRANILAGFDIHRPYPGIPDFAIEVISPGDTAENVQRKLRIYLEKGTEEVWLVYPLTQEIYQYRRGHDPEVRIYRDSGPVDTAHLFPGLALSVEAIFQLPPWAQT